MHSEGTDVEIYFCVTSCVVHMHCKLGSAGRGQRSIQRLARARVLREGGGVTSHQEG